MNIWIMRHGEAAFNASTDHQRSLTEKGKITAIQQGEWLAQRLLKQNLQLDHVIVSPFIRAQQTWQEVQKGMQAVTCNENFAKNLFHNVENWEGVTPYGNTSTVLDYTQMLHYNGASNVLIISHLPLVYELVAAFTQHQSQVHFYPAVIAEVEWDSQNGTLVTSKMPA
ncbi:phosphohistidine phosphatase SixA [Pasteurella skyensis]|uniref:Phosphohistidine phosphatase SixA n=1 Tax=Phocoenobacter skyensis TaxID=97481 RepID=A0AAJ6NZP3_9PAST|nr:phosphohistidine phosphatase SixA [Pasteurella skyensis]MDP8161683.1 phosphohistidine phosphatase SixA [Pasteurella skyensis]MDP8171839.1 phosphohistidine phosphatase SixA [Pasteurella skyensis]MDP8176076.1 phosphohistidine phosphatase SixA [Pasteurella skyensis]MDP8178094.1 phosphohistidine phosphatase SixA [Pasteurella skyensis]MDP8182298.1 phosphohistidine phosphatase SixA [Pasteurella skyensis]